MATPEARLEALGRLAKTLCDDDALVREIGVAWNEPERYVAEFGARLSNRGIDAPTSDLAFIALIDALQQRKRCIEIDWRTDPREMVSAVRVLLRGLGRKGWKAPKLDDGEELSVLLGVVGTSLEGMGQSLCALDHQSDSYALVVLATEHVEAATALARLSDVGRLSVWRADEIPRARPAIVLRSVTAVDVEWSEPPRQFFALPRRRFVTFDGTALSLAGPDGAGSIAIDRDLLPDFDPAASPPAHVLVRSGQAFGLASRQFVRLCSPAGESVLYRNDPPLAPNDRGSYAGAVSGGISDDPAVVVAVFHGAVAASDEVHPVVLRLATGNKKKIARFDELGPQGGLGHANRDRLPMSSAVRLAAHLRRTPRLRAIAWLDDSPYVVASGNEEGSPSYGVFSRYYAPFGHLERLIDLGEDCMSRVSSSFAHLLVTYPRREGRPCAVFSIAHPSRPARAVELPPGATLLDHEDDAFWYFEPRGSRGRCVLADPTNL